MLGISVMTKIQRHVRTLSASAGTSSPLNNVSAINCMHGARSHSRRMRAAPNARRAPRYDKGSRLSALQPHVGMARSVNHAKKFHQPFIAANAVADRVSKPGQNEAPDVPAPRSPSFRRLHDAFDGSLGLVEKRTTKIATLLFEVTRRCDQLDLKGRVKPTIHESAARALRKISV